MTHNGKRVCAATNADAFINATRPIYKDKACPTGYKSCSSKTSLSNTTCVKDMNRCPITFFTFIDEKTTYAEEDGYSYIPLTTGKWLVYSKTHDGLPVTRTKVSQRPCMDSFVEPTVGIFSAELE